MILLSSYCCKNQAKSSSNVEYDWEEPRTIMEVQNMIEKTKDDALMRENALAYIFSRQVQNRSTHSHPSSVS